MKNFHQQGDALDLTAPYAVASGGGFQVGALFAVAATAASAGAAVVGCVEGVFWLDKVAAEAWSAGDRVYWNDSTKLCTVVADGHLLVGAAAAAAATASATGLVRLGDTTRRAPLTATAALDFGAVAAGGSAERTVAVAGAAVGDAVALGLPAAVPAGVLFQARVSAPDTVRVQAVNVSGTVAATAGTIGVLVIEA